MLAIDEVLAPVRAGADVQVCGEPLVGRDMTLIDALTSSDPGNHRYKLGVSIVRLVVAAEYFLRRWRLSALLTGREERRHG